LWSETAPGVRRAYSGGEWTHFVVVYEDATGRQVQEKLGADIVNVGQARDYRYALLADIKRGVVPAKTNVTLLPFAQEWVQHRENHKDHREVGYLAAYIGKTKHDPSLREADADWLLNFLDAFERGELGESKPANSSVVSLQSTMRLIFDRAMVKHKTSVPFNPYDGIPRSLRKKRRKAEARQPQLLSVERANEALDIVHEFYAEAEGLIVLQATGSVRLGVSLGLQWGDIDHENDVICFRRQWTGVTEMIEGKAVKRYAMKEQHKEGEALVVIAIPDAFRPFISEAAREAARWGTATDFVFPSSRRDRPKDPDNVRRTYRKIATRMGLDRFSPHDWRHTMATILDDLGETELGDVLQNRNETAQAHYAHRRNTPRRVAAAAALRAKSGIGERHLVAVGE
jgi:integrase